MALTLSVDDVKYQVSEFSKIASGFKMKPRKPEKSKNPKKDDYVHILRDGKIIGCFVRRKNAIVFVYHDSHPFGRKKNPKRKAKEIPVNKLKTRVIENIVLKTEGKKPRA